jgi:XTP/dITP diphosphohydrolase
LKDINYHQDIPEPYDTLEANAQTKAETIFKETGRPVFSEDTGLFVEALQGRPGVHSARYAGESGDAEANMQKLLAELGEETNRAAYFKTVICFYTGKEVHFFEGICSGQIAMKRLGDGGFGYDPLFIPEGKEQSFAELGADEKNNISHRAKAFQSFVAFLENRNKS